MSEAVYVVTASLLGVVTALGYGFHLRNKLRRQESSDERLFNPVPAKVSLVLFLFSLPLAIASLVIPGAFLVSVGGFVLAGGFGVWLLMVRRN